jgi:hypothetical protein
MLCRLRPVYPRHMKCSTACLGAELAAALGVELVVVSVLDVLPKVVPVPSFRRTGDGNRNAWSGALTRPHEVEM